MENNKLKEYLHSFRDAVLTGLNAQGYPVSVRCQPEIDETEHTLQIHLPADIQIVPGPAGLLCHSHDEKLWHLKSFALQGTLEHQEDISLFHVQRFLPGINMAGAPGPITTLIRARRTMKQALQKRGLPQPSIPWTRMKQLADPSEHL
ncbi:hypothetical protein KSD_70170 [Ktedonobacter sp. SOSP1-85]|uniref:hypothetical protein n=1 Tax=Ktedonobacter sp. SOSP1-85 TaxID=2778367 RepID=UPI001915F3BA|nr:hypothetical protein [Ktedonobacter sp. SOSP1-85]GHO79246.1 hypothetical protein KSD_70170 [Ktedonobacter sp. SOSP1-85]